MKTILIMLICTLASTFGFSQSSKFNGDWSGKINIDDASDPLWVRLKIQNGNVTQYFYDSQTETWNATSPLVEKHDYNKNNYVYLWMNNSTIWSETQTFMLSYVNEDEMYLVWSRQVNNIKAGDNEVWSRQGTGSLMRRN